MYKFVCPGCNVSYIGKTDRCLYTRVKEHAKSDKTEIYNHVHECEQFEHVFSLLNLPSNLLDIKYRISIVDLIFNHCFIIDLSNDWSLLLFKEPYHLRDKTLLDLPTVKSAMGQSTFKYAAAKDWNSLPSELRDITSLSRFKRSVYTYLAAIDNASHIWSI